MFKRHRQTRQRSGRQRPSRPPAVAPVCRIAPARLSLPLIQAPGQFTIVRKPASELTATATALVAGGWLTPAMYKAHAGNLARCISAAVAAVAKNARPNPVADLSAQVWDSAERAEIEYGSDHDEYNARHKCTAQNVSVIVVGGDCTDPVHRVIGPRLAELEKYRAGLGATVLYWLSTALDKTISACEPRSGLGWAQHNYWMGEDDESNAVEERLADEEHYHNETQKKLPAAQRQPFNKEKAIAEMGIFTRAKYDAQIPTWASKPDKPPLTLEQLSRIRLPAYPKTLTQVFSGAPDLIAATIATAKLTEAAPRYVDGQDGACFENMRYEICPFLLRWSKTDSLGMIWDDLVNTEFQAGETNMGAMAAFGFHDGPSLIKTMHRFERWCQLLSSAETLLNLIQPKDLD